MIMTTDQLTPEQKAASPFFETFWASRGWGLGLSIVTRRDDVASVPGRFGWAPTSELATPLLPACLARQILTGVGPGCRSA
jgi:hypothetical protein